MSCTKDVFIAEAVRPVVVVQECDTVVVVAPAAQGPAGVGGADISAELDNQLTTGFDGGLYVPSHRKTFEQSVPLEVWTVPHNLEAFPSATVVDHLGSEITADVTYVDENIIQVTFSVPVAGRVFLN